MARKKTPEELKREKEGAKFIQEREKRASELGGTKGAQRQAAKELTIQAEAKQIPSTEQVPSGALEAGRIQEEELKKKLGEQLAAPAPIDISKEKTLSTKAAELGLQPATALANIAGKTLSRQTFGAIPFTPQTAEQLAQTGFGKGLGIATAVTGGALAFVGLGSISAAVGGTAGKALSLKLSAGSLLAGGGVLGVFNVKTKFSDAKSIITDSNTQTSQLITNLENNLITPEDAMAQFKRIQGNIASAESSIKIINEDSILNFINGGRDAAVDIAYARDDMNAKRTLLINHLATRQLGRPLIQ